MAFELQLSNFVAGLESDAAKSQGTLQFLAGLATPTTEAVMRTAMELGQPLTPDGRASPYTDAGWLALMSQLSNLDLDETALTAQERSVINTIRQVVTPDPKTKCCTDSGIVPSNGDGLTTLTGFARVGSATFEHEIQLKLDNSLTCDVQSCEITLTPIGIAPAVTSTNPFAINFSNCDANGDSIYKFLWATFAADPAGESYTIDYNFLDADALAIATYTAAYNLNL
jgi:hypothetical protein